MSTFTVTLIQKGNRAAFHAPLLLDIPFALGFGLWALGCALCGQAVPL